jgi:hypothetical protein
VEEIHNPRHRYPGGSRQGAWQHTDKLDEDPGKRVLESLTHVMRKGLTVAPEKTGCQT